MSKDNVTHEEFTKKHTGLVMDMMNWHKKEIKILEKHLDKVRKEFDNKGEKDE